MNRRTWKTSGRLCENCGHGLMAHQDQTFCPAVPTSQHFDTLESRLAAAEARVTELTAERAKWASDKQFLLRTIESQSMQIAGIDPKTLTPREPTNA
jgi:uncharacterized Zn finger protein (UPF0148 family)